MNAGVKWRTAYVAVATLLVGCGQGDSANERRISLPPTETRQSTPEMTRRADTTIKVKGFYIGMPGTSVCDLINSKYLDIFKPPQVGFIEFADTDELDYMVGWAGEKPNSCVYFFTGKQPSWEKLALKPISITTGNKYDRRIVHTATYDKCFLAGNTIWTGIQGAFRLDAQGNIDQISFSSDTANALFNASQMEASEFVKQFVTAYNIPEMRVSDDMEFWTYTNSDGIRVKIDGRKSVLIERVASVEERKQAFD